MSSLEGTRRGLDVSRLIFLSFFCAGSVLCSRFHLQGTRSALPCPLASRWLLLREGTHGRRERGEDAGEFTLPPLPDHMVPVSSQELLLSCGFHSHKCSCCLSPVLLSIAQSSGCDFLPWQSLGESVPHSFPHPALFDVYHKKLINATPTSYTFSPPPL